MEAGSPFLSPGGLSIPRNLQRQRELEPASSLTAENLTPEEEAERATLDDTEQIFFIQQIADALIARGYYSQGDRKALADSLFLWWSDGGEDSFAGTFRRVFCDREKLRLDLYRELKTTEDHRKRADIIARWFGAPSLEQFVEHELPTILSSLSRNGPPLRNVLALSVASRIDEVLQRGDNGFAPRKAA